MAPLRLCSIPDCGKPHFGRGYCNAHYSRLRKHGDPMAGGPAPGRARYYFDNVVVPYRGDDCLIWPFAKNGAGYGKLGMDGKFPHVHRLACEIVNGPPPSPKHEAAHSCGNGHLGCCNPVHVRWATPKENQADRIFHGTDSRGDRNGGAKLTAENVAAIRSLAGKLPEESIAAQFGVSRGCVSGVLTGKNWGWLHDEAAERAR